MYTWLHQRQADGSHHALNAQDACSKLELPPEYEEVFIEIAREWEERTKSAAYLTHFIKAGILNLCKSPDDFRKASSIILPFFDKIQKDGDGSVEFVKAILAEIAAGNITNLERFAFVCQNAFQQNEEFRATPEGLRVIARDGTQYPEYVQNAIKGAVTLGAKVKLA